MTKEQLDNKVEELFTKINDICSNKETIVVTVTLLQLLVVAISEHMSNSEMLNSLTSFHDGLVRGTIAEYDPEQN